MMTHNPAAISSGPHPYLEPNIMTLYSAERHTIKLDYAYSFWYINKSSLGGKLSIVPWMRQQDPSTQSSLTRSLSELEGFHTTLLRTVLFSPFWKRGSYLWFFSPLFSSPYTGLTWTISNPLKKLCSSATFSLSCTIYLPLPLCCWMQRVNDRRLSKGWSESKN